MPASRSTLTASKALMSRAARPLRLTLRQPSDRSRRPLPPHLDRLLLHSFNGDPTADFPSRLYTYACLSHFDQTYGPLADAHVHNDPETRRPTNQIEVVLPVQGALEALEIPRHTITVPLESGVDEKAHAAHYGYQISLRGLIGPFPPASDKYENVRTFTVAARRMEPAEKPTMNNKWYDAWETLNLATRDARKRPAVVAAFKKFGGFRAQPAPEVEGENVSGNVLRRRTS